MVLALALGCLLLASLARAELVERGDLFVKFQGGIFPTALPRQVNAPISVQVEGTIKTLSGEHPPALRWIAIAINRGGRLETKGLPICKRRQIVAASSRQALTACRGALVGEGSYVGAAAFPEQNPFPLRGRILAFNAVIDGKRAILGHVYGVEPFPNSRILVFHIHRSSGTFGTVLTAALPRTVNHRGYLRRISLDLDRRYLYHGRVHSYLSAACAAPSGFNGATFPFVRVSMRFADGRALASTLIRSCTVRSSGR